MAFPYFYDGESSQFAFYRIPKLLFSDERFSMLSTDAKLLYGMMIDRMELSARNHWCDSRGRIYIYYPIEEIKEVFQCSNDKAIKLVNELDSRKGIGLIEIIRQGQGKPNRIYVRNFVSDVLSDMEYPAVRKGFGKG